MTVSKCDHSSYIKTATFQQYNLLQEDKKNFKTFRGSQISIVIWYHSVKGV